MKKIYSIFIFLLFFAYSDISYGQCKWSDLRADIVAAEIPGQNNPLLAFLKQIEPKESRLNAWSAMYPLDFTPVVDQIFWIGKVDAWQKQGLDIRVDGNILEIKTPNGSIIGEVENKILLVTDNPRNYGIYNFQGDPVGEVINGCQLKKNANGDYYYERVPDVSPYTVNERAILKGDTKAHCLENHGVDVTDEALFLRAEVGIAPDGLHNMVGANLIPLNSTKFSNVENIRDCLEVVGPSSSKYQNAYNEAIASGAEAFSIQHTFDNTTGGFAAIGEGYRAGTSVKLDEINTVFVNYRKKQGGGFYLETMYPKII